MLQSFRLPENEVVVLDLPSINPSKMLQLSFMTHLVILSPFLVIQSVAKALYTSIKETLFGTLVPLDTQ
jgi:hypothetical protein